MSKTAVVPSIRAIDVHIGDFYRVGAGQVKIIIQITKRVTDGVWLSRNTSSGGDRYVVLGDLIAKVDAPVPPTEPESSQRKSFDASLNERLRRATGASDD